MRKWIEHGINSHDITQVLRTDICLQGLTETTKSQISRCASQDTNKVPPYVSRIPCCYLVFLHLQMLRLKSCTYTILFILVPRVLLVPPNPHFSLFQTYKSRSSALKPCNVLYTHSYTLSISWKLSKYSDLAEGGRLENCNLIWYWGEVPSLESFVVSVWTL